MEKSHLNNAIDTIMKLINDLCGSQMTFVNMTLQFFFLVFLALENSRTTHVVRDFKTPHNFFSRQPLNEIHDRNVFPRFS